MKFLTLDRRLRALMKSQIVNNAGFMGHIDHSRSLTKWGLKPGFHLAISSFSDQVHLHCHKLIPF